MKLSSEALLEIMSILQDAILNGKDASDALRELDLAEKQGGLLSDEDVGKLVLTEAYKLNHARAGAWVDEPGEA